jgi:hypothetical protein
VQENGSNRLAFLRFSRDKRGYEHFYLIEPPNRRNPKARARVLYWFRTPPGVKVGREPFDAELRRTLEARYPDVEFEWQKYVETPIPPLEPEHWRERRRVERATKQAARAEAAVEAETAAAGEPASEASTPPEIVAGPPAVVEPTLESGEFSVEQPAPAAGSGQPPGGEAPRTARRRRRRRRGRRGGHRDGQPMAAAAPVPGGSVEPTEGQSDVAVDEPYEGGESDGDGEV